MLMSLQEQIEKWKRIGAVSVFLFLLCFTCAAGFSRASSVRGPGRMYKGNWTLYWTKSYYHVLYNIWCVEVGEEILAVARDRWKWFSQLQYTDLQLHCNKFHCVAVASHLCRQSRTMKLCNKSSLMQVCCRKVVGSFAAVVKTSTIALVRTP